MLEDALPNWGEIDYAQVDDILVISESFTKARKHEWVHVVSLPVLFQPESFKARGDWSRLGFSSIVFALLSVAAFISYFLAGDVYEAFVDSFWVGAGEMVVVISFWGLIALGASICVYEVLLICGEVRTKTRRNYDWFTRQVILPSPWRRPGFEEVTYKKVRRLPWRKHVSWRTRIPGYGTVVSYAQLNVKDILISDKLIRPERKISR